MISDGGKKEAQIYGRKVLSVNSVSLAALSRKEKEEESFCLLPFYNWLGALTFKLSSE